MNFGAKNYLYFDNVKKTRKKPLRRNTQRALIVKRREKNPIRAQRLNVFGASTIVLLVSNDNFFQ